MSTLMITKRDGSQQPLDINKIAKVTAWAAEGLDVSTSEVEMRAKILFFDGIKSADIHQSLVESASDLISERKPDYQYMASRLHLFANRKQAYKQFTPPSLLKHIQRMTKAGWYDKEILEVYTEDEINEFDQVLDHERDFKLALAGAMQMTSKYLIRDRSKKDAGPLESPNMSFMVISMVLFSQYPKETRTSYVKRFYEALSNFKISLPTPIMAGVRTPTRQFSSCVKISIDDSLDSINAGTSAIVKYISQRAGIGIDFGRIRALHSPIRGGEAVHTGLVPFIKHFQSAVKSCSQGN